MKMISFCGLRSGGIPEGWERMERGERALQTFDLPVRKVSVPPVEIEIPSYLTGGSWVPLYPESGGSRESQWKPFYRQAVTIGWLLDNYGEKHSMPLFDAHKQSYFLQRTDLVDLELPFRRLAAGPYASELTYKAGLTVKKHNFWEVLGQSNVKRGRNIRKAVESAEKLFRNEKQVRDLISRLSEFSHDDLGGLATVDFAARAVYENGQAITPESIRLYFASDWQEKVDVPWFSDENIHWALNYLEELGLFKKSEQEREEKTAKKEKVEVKPAKKKSKAETADYDLYKCGGCGQMIADFDKEVHVRTAHGEADQDFRKL